MFQEAIDNYRRILAQRAVSRYDVMAALLPLAIITVAEALFFLGSRGADVGGTTDVVLLHAFNIAVCILVPIALKLDNSIYQVYSLLSVLRLLTIGMPNFSGEWMDWALLVYIPLIPVIWFALMDERFRFTMEPGEFPFRDLIKETWLQLRSVAGSMGVIAVGIIAGSVLGIAGHLLMDVPELVSGLGIREMLVAALSLFLAVSLVEELLFRRMLLVRVGRRFGSLVAVVVTSFAFAVMHSGYASLTMLAFMFAVGVVLCMVYIKTESLASTVAMNGSMLLVMMAIAPYLL